MLCYVIIYYELNGNYHIQIEWNMKVNIEISICTGLMLNDHSNPYIESTTVLSDTLPPSSQMWSIIHSIMIMITK